MAREVCIVGHFADLPYNRDASVDTLVGKIENNEVLYFDLLERGIFESWEVGDDVVDGNPWLVHTVQGQKFLIGCPEGDMALMQVAEKESKFMDLFQVMCLSAVWKGLENCGIPATMLQGTNTGVFVAGYALFGGYESYPDESSLRGSLNSSLSDRISYFLGTHGPSITLETACSSSLTAMTIAADAIKNGSCPVAIVVGMNAQNREYELALQATGVVSKSGQCRPFDERADGTVRCEGSGCIILASLDWAKENRYTDSIKCVLLNATTGSAGAAPHARQGSGRVYEQPNADGMVSMIKLCHKQINLPLESISYVEAHATGTPVGDLIELQALKAVYQDSHDLQTNPLRVGSIKGNIGHAEIAAGLFSTIKAIEMLRRRKFLPTGGKNICPRSDFDWDGSNIKLCLERESFPPHKQVCISVNSFGVGGAYAHVILSEYDRQEEEMQVSDGMIPLMSNGEVIVGDNFRMPLIFSISAATVEHLDAHERDIGLFLRKKSDVVKLIDMCGCFAINRTRLSVCRNYLVRSVKELESKLSAKDKPKICEGFPQAKVAFVFTGQGSQWVSMGSKLMIFKAYRDAVMQFDTLFKELSGWSPVKMLESLDEDTLDDTMYAQPLTFMVQLGLERLFKYFGVVPVAAMGHSAGEIAALCCGGYLSLEQAVRVVYHRSWCQQHLAGTGKMLALQMSRVDAMDLLKLHQSSVANCEIACHNSPSSVVVAGPRDQLQALETYIPKGIKFTYLKGSTAFHSACMDPCLAEVHARLKFLDTECRCPMEHIPVVSTVTGDFMAPLTASYIVDNIREPVNFFQAMERLGEVEPDVLLELGPHKTLIPSMIECLGETSRVKVISSLCKREDDIVAFWQTLLGLMDCNLPVNISTMYRDLGYQFSNVENMCIPRHPFLKPRPPALREKVQRKIKYPMDVGPAVGTLDSSNNPNLHVAEISQATCPAMMDHVMGGQALLPGMYFVEAALEAWASDQPGSAVVMNDISFKAMCQIPDRLKNQGTKRLFVRRSSERKNGLIHYTVESKPLEENELTIHCTGTMSSFQCPTELDGTTFIPGTKGYKERLPELKDIGPKGLAHLFRTHPNVLTGEQAYSMINCEGRVEYGPKFQVIKEARMNADSTSIVGVLSYDNKSWTKRGGMYGIQLLDGMLQLGFLIPALDPGSVVFAGGFEMGVFARRPTEDACVVLLESFSPIPSGPSMITGNAWMYDSNGKLLVYLQGIKSIYAQRISEVLDVFQIWQPLPTIENKSQQLLIGQSTLASCVFHLLEAKHKFSKYNIACLRLLECSEDNSQPSKIFDSLVHTKDEDLPGIPFLVELFVATHNTKVAETKFHIPLRHRKWLKVRILFLPSAWSILRKFRFDVISAWTNTFQERTVGWNSPRDLLLDAGTLGHMGCLVFHDFMFDQSCSNYVSQEGDLDAGIFVSRIQTPALFADQSTARDILILSDNSHPASHLFSLLSSKISSFRSRWSIQVSSLEQSGESLREMLDNFARANPGNGKHVVILDGIFDSSRYAQRSFVRIARAAHILGSLMRDVEQEAFMWIVTSEVYSGAINVDHSSLPSLARSITNEFQLLSGKVIDVEDPARSFHTLSSLLVYHAGCDFNMIDKDGMAYEYYLVPTDIEGIYLSKESSYIAANDPLYSYRCELLTCQQTAKIEYGFFKHPVQALKSNEVLVEVHAASLNFRDVMLTLNALPKASFERSFYGRSLGMEASGIVSQVGERVADLKPGDLVLVCEPGCFSSKLVALANNVLKIPEGAIDLHNAATLSSVYCTSYYALIQLANVQRGERVLIHAAAGGVGHAAVSICKFLGAEIYITASEGKQKYCATQLGIPKSNIFNSRDTSWFMDLMNATNDEGVDVVINSLAGEHQRLGLESLKPGGRFCEIGKIDIFNNESVYQYLFRKNLAFFAIDMDRMNLDNPGKIKEISEKVFNHVAKGDFALIPFKVFSMDRIQDAVEYMKSGSHIGKILLSNYQDSQPVQIMCREAVRFNPAAHVFVLGGAGGFGSRLIQWAFDHGARKFTITVSRNPSRVTSMFQHLISKGASFQVLEVDLSRKEQLEKIEQHLLHEVDGPVETLIHCAGIFEEFNFNQEIPDTALDSQACIKNGSAMFLHDLSIKLDGLKHFIIVGSSSMDTLAHFMCTYSATNSMLAGLARKRETMQLPCTILNMTSIKDVGLVQKDSRIEQFQRAVGIEAISSIRAIGALETIMSRGTPSMLHYQYLSPEKKEIVHSYWSETFGTAALSSGIVFGTLSSGQKKQSITTYDEIFSYIKGIMQELFGEQELSPGTLISSMGVDSFGMIEFGQHLQEDLGFKVDPTVLSLTIGEFADSIYKKTTS